MKKTINLFNRVLVALVLCAGLVVTGCYDDSALLGQIGKHDEQLKDHESRLKELERLVAQQNTNLESLQTIVNALQERDYVTSVAPIKEGEEIIGYTITFSKSGAVTIYNGEDGYVPAMGVKQDEDGQWYWTVDGEWMTDSNGNKVRASAIDGDKGETGVTPQLKIVDGYWYVSYDGGKTWEEETLGQATGDKGYTIFTEVSYDDDYLYITMADGTKLTLPRASSDQGEGGDGDTNQVGPVAMELSELTVATVTFTGIVTDVEAIPYIEKIAVYYKEASETFSILSARSASTSKINSDNTVSITVSRLAYNTSYSYCLYVKSRGVETYSDVKQFTTVNIVPSVSVVESSVTATTASFSGTVTGLSEIDKSDIEVGMAYSTESADLQSDKSTKVPSGEISEDGTYSMSIYQFYPNTKYYYCTYVKQNGIYKYGEVKEFTTKDPYVSAIKDLNMSSATDLSSSESANCYIVSQSGTYKFKTVKGNSSTSVGDVASCTILWESFGTSTTPEYCSLISGICYKDNYIAFETPSTFTEGNAVLAAKDASGKILWSWHIWLTDKPAEHVYNNNAGTMMDRNLGATSATPGDVGALGLLYQWGRKDPFLGSSSISDNVDATSTLTWPSVVESTSSTGTTDYVTANPTTYVTYNNNNNDWYYTGSLWTDNTRWQSEKTIYDPCPAGWRVPDGGGNGVWSTALGSSSYFDYSYDSINEGMNFSGKFGSASTIWYPASGCRSNHDGALESVGYYGGLYWSVTPYSDLAYHLYFSHDGVVNPLTFHYRASGFAVRCLQESK